MKLFTMAIFALLAANSVNAANKYTESAYEIEKLTFYSINETVYPEWSGVVAVHPKLPIVWHQSTSCETGVVVIRQGDSHLISAVLAAHTSSKPIKFYTDDFHKVEGNFCFLRAIGY